MLQAIVKYPQKFPFLLSLSTTHESSYPYHDDDDDDVEGAHKKA
jgi:hypothetical protein